MDNIFNNLNLNDFDDLLNLNFGASNIKDTTTQNNETVVKEIEPEVLFEDESLSEQQQLAKAYAKEINTPNKDIGNEDIKKEEPTVPVQDTTSNVDNTTKEDKDSLLVPYVNSILEAGLLPNFNKEEFNKLTSPESQAEFLIQAQEDESQRRAESILEEYVKTLPPKFRAAFENYSDGINLDDAFGYADKLDKLKNYSIESLEDKETAKRMIREDLKEQGLDEEAIDDTLDNMISYTDTAKKSLNRRVLRVEKKIETDKKNSEQRELEDKEKSKNQVKEIKNYIDTKSEFIPGVPLTPQQRKEVYEVMMNPVGKDKYGQPIGKIAQDREKDPLGFETRLIQTYVLTKGFTDLSALMGMKNTKAIKNLEEQLRMNKLPEGSPAYDHPTNKSENLMDAIRRTAGQKK